MVDAKTHWENIYATIMPTELSWYQAHPRQSLAFIQRAGIGFDEPIIDVGGGASLLVDHLLDAGYRNVTVLDISATALQHARGRLSKRAALVHWIEGDLMQVELPEQHYAVWHDRALLHFLTDPTKQAQYVSIARAALRPGGHLIVATFALDGPTHCSDLEVIPFDVKRLQDTFGADFILVDGQEQVHQTPWQSEQKFVFCYLRKAS